MVTETAVVLGTLREMIGQSVTWTWPIIHGCGVQ